jgi:hypothetical protein
MVNFMLTGYLGDGTDSRRDGLIAIEYRTRRNRECAEVYWTGPAVYIIENLEEKW